MKNRSNDTHTTPAASKAAGRAIRTLGALTLSMLAHCGGDVIRAPLAQEGAEHAEGDGPVLTGTFDLPGGRQRLSYRLVNGHRMFQGDIALPASEEERATLDRSTLSAGRSAATFRWPGNTVVYKLESDLPAATVTNINSAITHWTRNTSIRFRVRTTESDYVEFSNDGVGCWSNVGRSTGMQTINLENGQCSAGSTIHEIGHTVGLWHEQSRTDRDGFVVVDTDCVDVNPDDQRHNFNVLTSGVNYGLYDYDSIMHYNSTAFYTNNAVPAACGSSQYTLWRSSSVGAAQDSINAQRTGLSFLDRQGVEEMYSEGMGQSIAVGDFNGDGYRDVAIGAPRGGASNAGRVRIYRGSAAGTVFAVDLAQATLSPSSDRFGYSLTAADFNGDGFADLAVGVPGKDLQEGSVTVYRGRSSNTNLLEHFVDLSQAGLSNREAGDRFGFSLSAADINNDGYADLAVGAPGEGWGSSSRSAGAVFLFRGGSTLTAWTHLGQSGLDTNESGDSFGASVHLRNLDSDDYADLAVGAPMERDGTASQGGVVYLFRGSTAGESAWRTIRPAIGATNYNEQDMYFGFSLATGDIDGDGRRELVVGAPGATVSSTPWAGRVFVYRGSTTGPQNGWVTLTAVSPHLGGAFGFSLAAARFNGDTRADLAIGTPGVILNSNTGSGTVQTFMGASTGLTLSNTLSQSSVGFDESGDRLGASVAVGDFDGDGDDDLAAGAPGDHSVSGVQSGYGYVYRSNGTAVSGWTSLAP